MPRPADQQAEFVVAVAAYQRRTTALRARVERYVRRVWVSLGSYRNGDMQRFVDQVVPFVVGAQQTMTALTVANLTRQAEIALGVPRRPAAVDVKTTTGSAARNGAVMAEVYGRPFHLTWRLLDTLPREPGMVDQAIAAGADRAAQSALTDLQRTKQLTAAQIISRDPKAYGYRRALEGPSSCALCIVASTRLYFKAELMPMHPACDCTPVPVYKGEDFAAALNERFLEVAHARVADMFGSDSSAARRIGGAVKSNGDPLLYRDVLIEHHHGELGPVLAVRGAPFTGPSDL